MEFFKKRGVALAVLVVAIVGAVFIGQSRKAGFIAKEPTALADVKYQSWICDEAGLLSESTKQTILDYNASWDQKYYAIVAVASIDHLTGWDGQTYAAKLGEAWGLGRNDMILLLVKDGDWQVYCGDDVGYAMTDTQQSKLRQAIETTYYSGDFDGAVTAFFRQADVFYAQARLDSSGDSYGGGWDAPSAPAAAQSGGASLGAVLMLIICIFVVWMVLDGLRYSRYRRRYIVGAPVNVVRPVYYPIFWGRQYAPPRPPRGSRPPRPPYGGSPRPPMGGGTPRPPRPAADPPAARGLPDPVHRVPAAPAVPAAAAGSAAAASAVAPVAAEAVAAASAAENADKKIPCGLCPQGIFPRLGLHVLAEEGRHGLRQLALRLPRRVVVRRQEQHRAQHVTFAEDRRGYGGAEGTVALGDGHTVTAVKAAAGHHLLQLR